MNQIVRVASAEWLYLLRTRLASSIITLLLAVVVFSAVNSALQLSAESQQRSNYQQQADEAFRTQPERHPHRVVHYGHYVFRTPAPLAAIDPGVDSFTGRSIFLEGHRRNTATFSEARETSVLTRFGIVSPAFSLQVLAPLLLILIGFSSVARERERGVLVQLLAQGLPASTLFYGKLLALAAVALLAISPLLTGAVWLGLKHPGEWLPALTMIAGHAVYLGFWVLVIVAVSAISRSARSALISLMVAWALVTVLMPRLAADVAALSVPSVTQTEMDIRIQEEMRIVGDSHDINDPGFQSFQERVLAEYGVSRIEDLPVNYRGLVSLQGEAEGSAVMNRYADELHLTQQRQANIISGFSLLSPYLAVRNLSMQSAGTDLINHQRFLDAAEAHRFELIQQINSLHAHDVSYADDAARSVDYEAEQRTRVSAEFWQQLREFEFKPDNAGNRVASASPLLLVLMAWLAAGAALIRWAIRQVGGA